MTIEERMAVLDEHIEKGREWPALEIISAEIKSLYRLIEGKKEDT